MARHAMNPKASLTAIAFAAGWLLPAAAAPLGATPLQEAEPVLLANIMINFSTPDYSGAWRGWNYGNDMVRHDPERRDAEGRRDIASVYYPAVGPYDMRDPRTAEYHCQLMRMAGIDGGVFDVAFFSDPNARGKNASFSREVVDNYLRAFAAYGLKGVVMFEQKAHWLWNAKLTSRAATARAALADLDAWLRRFEPVQYAIGERPLVFMFSYAETTPNRGESRLRPEELLDWRRRFPPEDTPVIAVQWFDDAYQEVHEGIFEWPAIKGLPEPGSDVLRYNSPEKEREIWEDRHAALYRHLASGRYTFIAGGVWPGFDDEGCMGWGEGRRIIPREDGDIYAYHWGRMIASRYPVVQIVTWNDWFEGTNIEPAEEYGTQYLALTRKFAAHWRGDAAPEGNLEVPVWIYKLRKGNHAEAARAAAQAAEAIRHGQFTIAEELIEPYRALVQ